MSDIKLKPCPLCQSPHVCIMLSPQQEDGSRFYYGFCYECCSEAGEGDTEAQAAAAWNSLPRRLQWTSATPTEPGWYFSRVNSIVDVVLLGGSTEWLCVLDGGKLCPVDGFNHGRTVEWAGPIPEPKESEKATLSK